MNRTYLQLLAALVLSWPASWAQATITCNVTSPGFITDYDPTAPDTIVQSQLTVTCQRNDDLNDPGSQTFSIRANNGQYATGGGTNRARLTTANRYIRYELYSDSGCGSLWSNNSTRITGSMNLTGLSPSSVDISYWGCIPTGQQSGRPAGTYLDNVTMTLYRGTTGFSFLDSGSLPVTILHKATCSVSTAPGSVAISYTSFGAAANASTTFGATCTDTLPYTLSLDSTSGTLLGLNYSLSFSTPGITGTLSTSGTGAEQTHTIYGTMAGGQSGTCATGVCNASQTHTLTISY
jgi:spore coat protein U-like protein